jgi:HAMP domain-containing protein
MTVPTIRGVIRRNLLIVFLIALVAGGGGFYLLLERAAMDNAEQQAELMLSSALAVRGYTTKHILPNFQKLNDAVFHEETVPAFAAQTVFRSVSAGDSAYSYREAGLNPTAPSDRAGAFEVDLIRQFRNDANLKALRGVIDSGNQRLFYLARPMRIKDPNCLICHDTPARAPKVMLAKYGPNNGFGWHVGDIIAVQLLTVPVTQQFRSTVELVGILIGGLALIFALAYFALTAAMEATVAAPLSRLAQAAEQASRSTSTTPELPVVGAREIRMLSEAIQRLRISLVKALAQIGGKHD